MTIVDRKYRRTEAETAFFHAVSGKTLCRLEAKLNRDDWEKIQGLIGMVYNVGKEVGSKQRAAEIREALGIEEQQ